MVTAVNSRMCRVRAAMWPSTTVGAEDRNGRSCRSPTAEAVEAEFLREQGAVQYFAETLLRGLQYAGDRVGPVHDQGDGEELHDATRSVRAWSGWARPRWSRRWCLVVGAEDALFLQQRHDLVGEGVQAAGG